MALGPLIQVMPLDLWKIYTSEGSYGIETYLVSLRDMISPSAAQIQLCFVELRPASERSRLATFRLLCL